MVETSAQATTAPSMAAPSVAGDGDPLICPVRRWHRWIYLGLGYLFVGLGMAGAVLPVLPTTPFLLLAVWAFSRSSRRLHDWLYDHPRFGAPLRAWRDHRVVPIRAKIASLSAMSLSMLYVGLFTPSPLWSKGAMALCLFCVGCWISTRPSHQPPPPGSPSRANPEQAESSATTHFLK